MTRSAASGSMRNASRGPLFGACRNGIQGLGFGGEGHARRNICKEVRRDIKGANKAAPIMHHMMRSQVPEARNLSSPKPSQPYTPPALKSHGLPHNLETKHGSRQIIILLIGNSKKCPRTLILKQPLNPEPQSQTNPQSSKPPPRHSAPCAGRAQRGGTGNPFALMCL